MMQAPSASYCWLMACPTAASSPLASAYCAPITPCNEVISTTMLVAKSALARLAARAATEAGKDPTAAVTTWAIPVVVLCMVVFGWVRFRADIHEAMSQATGGGT